MNSALFVMATVLAPVFLAPLLKDVAYLDPGSGSLLIQLIIATAVGILFAIRTYWGKIKAAFQKLFSKQEHKADEPEK